MGLFSFLHKGPKQMQHEVFGLITFRPYKALNMDYFVGNVYFPPIRDDVDLFIYADYKGPTQFHQEFFKKLENNYSAYIEKATPLLLEFINKTRASTVIRDFNTEFRLVCIVFPEPDTEEWKLGFSATHDPNHQYTVAYTQEEPTQMTVDNHKE